MIHHPTDRNIIMTAGPEVYVTDAAAGDWESCKTNDSCQFTAIGPSPSSTLGDVSRVAVDPDTGMYFAATTGGQLWMSNSQGTYWTIVFTPKYGVKVDSLIIDPHDSTRLWMTFEGSGPLMTAHRVVLIERFTSDCGAGEPWCPITYWKKSPISEGIPIELSIGAGWRASNLIEVDPEYENTIYVGTQRGMYKGVGSLDEDGVWDFTWTPMNCNLPWVHVSDVELNPTTNRLYAATWGRGLWSTSIEPPDDVIE
jgi:DNA-binding beta-propeller fold protein YncE